MNVHVIESDFSDNYFYLVVGDDDEAAVIDPVDAPSTIETVNELGVELAWVINTHFHHDHIAGDDEVLSEFGSARLAVAAGDAETITGNIEHSIDRHLSGGDELSFGATTLQVWDTPGHTPGHVSLTIGDHLFCGDTIFIAGAGNCSFGGDAGVLFETFRDVLTQFDDRLLIYPGHDYSVRDLEFCLDIEPENEEARELLEKARAHDGLFQTTLGRERSYSPFFRWDDEALAARLESERSDTFRQEAARSSSRAETVFRTVRALRNNW